MNENGREFLFDLFRESYYSELTLSDVYERMSKYSNYYEKSNLPTEIELTPEEIKRILSKIYELDGNYSDNTAVKGDIVSFVFGCVSNESKCGFLRSEFFRELQQESDWYPDQFIREYNIDKFLDSISDEGIDTLFENMSKREEAELKVALGILDKDTKLKTAIVNFANNPVKENQKTLELLFALNDMEVDFSAHVERENGEFFKSDVFKNAINTYYQGLSESEKNNFIFNLSRQEQTWGGPYWLGYNSPMIRTTFANF